MKPHRKPKKPAPADIHATIKAHALLLKSAPRFNVRDADELPEIAALMTAAMNAVRAAVPPTFTYEGRTYWLQALLAARLAIFEAPADGSPLVEGMSASMDRAGHKPGH